MRWLLVLSLITTSTHATVLVQAPGAPILDYRAALKADPAAVSPAKYYTGAHPSFSARDRLLNLYGEAQKAFLEKSKEEARARFLDVIGLLKEEDWARSDREVFLNSYFRVAQLELEPEKQDAWVAQALLVGQDLTPGADLFPPPLLNKFKQLNRELPRVQVPERWFDEGWSVILFNGVPCTRLSCQGPPAVPAEVRITFVSDQWLPFTIQTHTSEITDLQPKRIAWVGGSCEKPQFHNRADWKDKKAFWNMDCEAPGKTAIAVSVPAPSAKEDFPAMPIREKSPEFYKSKWFWAAAGVLTAAVLIAGSQKHKQEKEPTTTYGYGN